MRRRAESVATWRQAQMVLLSAQTCWWPDLRGVVGVVTQGAAFAMVASIILLGTQSLLACIGCRCGAEKRSSSPSSPCRR
ncbi:hypothetical protein [Nonomuraea sp. NPDC005501]|uniref:hypothetical protein n=1 Tax=Nonomuraea sp. NPDC005501 TaxID=3156884 RepID=UPI0033AC0544